MSGFGKQDLAKLLPEAEVGDALSLRHTEDGKGTLATHEFKPRVDPSKRQQRYRAGVAPSWAAEDNDDNEFLSHAATGMATEQQRA